MLPPIWRCFTIIHRVARRHVWRPTRHFAIRHTFAAAAISTTTCVMVAGGLIVAPPGTAGRLAGDLGWGSSPEMPDRLPGAPEASPGDWGVFGPGGQEIGGFVEHRHHHHKHREPIHVPEPSTIYLLGLGATIIILRHARK